jgi:hypothetical protein
VTRATRETLLLEAIKQSRWVPAFAGMTSQRQDQNGSQRSLG